MPCYLKLKPAYLRDCSLRTSYVYQLEPARCFPLLELPVHTWWPIALWLVLPQGPTTMCPPSPLTCPSCITAQPLCTICEAESESPNQEPCLIARQLDQPPKHHVGRAFSKSCSGSNLSLHRFPQQHLRGVLSPGRELAHSSVLELADL